MSHNKVKASGKTDGQLFDEAVELIETITQNVDQDALTHVFANALCRLMEADSKSAPRILEATKRAMALLGPMVVVREKEDKRRMLDALRESIRGSIIANRVISEADKCLTMNDDEMKSVLEFANSAADNALRIAREQ
jgi:hypothetical protein